MGIFNLFRKSSSQPVKAASAIGVRDSKKTAGAATTRRSLQTTGRKSGAIRLPYGRPGIRCTGTAYFLDTVAKMPLGETEITFEVKTNSENFHPPLTSAHIFWNGRPIGYMGPVESDLFSRALHSAAPTGKVFIAKALVGTSKVMELNDPKAKLEDRKTVRAMVPSPEVLSEWLRAAFEHRGKIEKDSLKENVSLKDKGKYQDQLTTLSRKHKESTFPAVINIEIEPSGKYKGQECLLFSAEGLPFGKIGARYRKQYANVFEAVLLYGTKTCVAQVRTSNFEPHDFYATAFIKVFS